MGERGRGRERERGGGSVEEWGTGRMGERREFGTISPSELTIPCRPGHFRYFFIVSIKKMISFIFCQVNLTGSGLLSMTGADIGY